MMNQKEIAIAANRMIDSGARNASIPEIRKPGILDRIGAFIAELFNTFPRTPSGMAPALVC